MKSSKLQQIGHCNSVKTTLNVIGGKWKPLILFLLTKNTHRFNELHRAINGVTQKVLAQQLRELEEDALISRKVFAEIPPKVEYSMTPFGKTLAPIFKLMNAWGKEYESRAGK